MEKRNALILRKQKDGLKNAGSSTSLLTCHGLAAKEFDSVLRAVGGVNNMIDWDGKSEEITFMKYMEDVRAKEDKLYDDPSLIKTPIVRNGKQATVGFKPEIWTTWE